MGHPTLDDWSCDLIKTWFATENSQTIPTRREKATDFGKANSQNTYFWWHFIFWKKCVFFFFLICTVISFVFFWHVLGCVDVLLFLPFFLGELSTKKLFRASSHPVDELLLEVLQNATHSEESPVPGSWQFFLFSGWCSCRKTACITWKFRD